MIAGYIEANIHKDPFLHSLLTRGSLFYARHSQSGRAFLRSMIFVVHSEIELGPRTIKLLGEPLNRGHILESAEDMLYLYIT